jgi:hypothetical protein
MQSDSSDGWATTEIHPEHRTPKQLPRGASAPTLAQGSSADFSDSSDGSAWGTTELHPELGTPEPTLSSPLATQHSDVAPDGEEHLEHTRSAAAGQHAISFGVQSDNVSSELAEPQQPTNSYMMALAGFQSENATTAASTPPPTATPPPSQAESGGASEAEHGAGSPPAETRVLPTQASRVDRSRGRFERGEPLYEESDAAINATAAISVRGSPARKSVDSVASPKGMSDSASHESAPTNGASPPHEELRVPFIGDGRPTYGSVAHGTLNPEAQSRCDDLCTIL